MLACINNYRYLFYNKKVILYQKLKEETPRNSVICVYVLFSFAGSLELSKLPKKVSRY
jgi:hypothetical protein